MRIIGGDLGGRKIAPPSKMPYTRPTTDIAKEGLFNILQNHIEFEGIDTLDLFGGTGAITYELQSRGAGRSLIIEKDTAMYAFMYFLFCWDVKNLSILYLPDLLMTLEE
jgi:16S rRNA G966 N2-methylase RsmD